MNIDEILQALTPRTNTLPREALREAAARREEITPRLLDALDFAIGNAERIKNGEIDYNLHLFSMFLLAQFRERRAYPRLIALMGLDQNTLDALAGPDTVIESFPSLLRDTFNGDLSLLKGVIENNDLPMNCRMAAIKTCGLLYRDGHISREDLIAYMRRLLTEVYTGNSEADREAYFGVADCAIDEQITELIPDIKSLYDRDMFDTFLYGDYDDFLRHISEPQQQLWGKHIDDTVKELESWPKFTKGGDQENMVPDFEFPNLAALAHTPAVRRAAPKIGRNDPCPCGSGKKYKKCCLNKPGAFK